MAHPERSPSKAFPIARLDLVEETRQLRASPIPHGHVAKTLLHNADLRVVLMVLQRGARIPQHQANGSILLQALDGRVVVTMLESSFDLATDNVLAIEPEVAHALVAIEDSALLLTIAH